MNLRPYQETALRRIDEERARGVTRQLIVMATGLGKTVIVSHLMKRFGSRIFGFLHRDTLIGQAIEKIRDVTPNIPIGVEKAGQTSNPLEDPIILSSVQTVGRKDRKRLSKIPPLWPRFVWLDESHHAPAKSFLEVLDHFGLYGDNPDREKLFVGTTATPDRLDELGYDQIFDDIVYQYGLWDGIRDGWLSDIHAWRIASDVDLSSVRRQKGDFKKEDLSQAIASSKIDVTAADTWSARCRDRRSLFFCVDSEHAHRTLEALRGRGAKAEMITQKTSTDDRHRFIRAFREGLLEALVNIEVLTEGFDAPECDCIHLLRPTQSGALYTQMVGRGTRRIPGMKDRLHLFDYTSREHDVFSIGQIFGLPDSWSLEGQSVTRDAAAVRDLSEGLGFKADGVGSLDELRVRLKERRIEFVKGALSDPGIPSKFAWIRPSPSRERWTISWKNETKNNSGYLDSKAIEDFDRRGLWGRTERIEIIRNPLGLYEAWGYRSGENGAGKWQRAKIKTDRSVSKVVGAIEKIVSEKRPQKLGLLRKSARWGADPISDPQKDVLRKKGVPDDILPHLNKREASLLLGTPAETIRVWFPHE